MKYRFRIQQIKILKDHADIFFEKSTLLRLINRLETPGEGEVVLNGEPLQDCSGQRDKGLVAALQNKRDSDVMKYRFRIQQIKILKDHAEINRLETPGEGEVVLNGEPLQDCSGQRLQAIKKESAAIRCFFLRRCSQ
jgi:ABC-type histidine transport system ATPase subunit